MDQDAKVRETFSADSHFYRHVRTEKGNEIVFLWRSRTDAADVLVHPIRFHASFEMTTRFILASHIYYLMWLSVFNQANYANVLDMPVSLPARAISSRSTAYAYLHVGDGDQWMMWSTIPLSGCVSLIVQGIYVQRLIKLNDNPVWMRWVMGGLIVTCFGGNMS
jgi:hypothetical protein